MKFVSMPAAAIFTFLGLVVSGCSSETSEEEQPGDVSGEESSEEVASTEQALTATYQCVAVKSFPSCKSGYSKYFCRSLNSACGGSFTTSCRTYSSSSFYLYAC